MFRFHSIRLALPAVILAVLMMAASAAAQSLPLPGAAPETETETGQNTPAPAVTPQAVDALISILKDDTARKALIDNLQKLQPPATDTQPASAPAPSPAASAQQGSATSGDGLSSTPFVRAFGNTLDELSRQGVEALVKVGYGLSNLRRLYDGSASFDWSSFGDLGLTPVLSFVIAVITYVLAHRLALLFVAMIDRAGRGQRWLARLVRAGAGLALETAALVAALITSAIYGLATSPGHRADPLVDQMISGFVTVEFVKLVIAAVFQSRFPSLAVLPASPQTARYWQRRLAWLVGFLGYGVLVAHPLVNRLVGFSVGIGFRMGVVLIALAAALAIVLRNREKVQHGLLATIASVRNGMVRTALAVLVHAWHVLAILYLLIAFLLWVSRPFDAVNFMARATAETLLALLLGGVVSNLMVHAMARGVRVPSDFREILPLLEQRLNLVVPMLLRVFRLIVAIAVIALILQSWHLIDLMNWVRTAAGVDFVGRIFTAMVIVVVAVAIWLAASSWVEFRLNPTLGRQTNARTRTLLSLFRNAFTVVVVVIGGMLTLSELGIDVAPLIAGAGVVGLAVGFGSQKLVQDIITGAFIQLENAMNEGDVVTVADISGVVDRLTIRSVGIRDLDGVYHVIPFSSVSSVSNFMRGFSYHVANIGVAYKEDIDAVKKAMQTAFDRLMQTEQGATVLEPLEMHGVTEFADSAVIVRARIKTLPGEQWATGRAYNEFIKKVFDEEGIEIPFPQRTVWMAGGESEPVRPPAPTAAGEAVAG